MKNWILVCSLVLACSFSAKAQDSSKVDIFGGYSYLRFQVPNAGLNGNGGSGQVTYNFNPMIGLTGDFGGYHFSEGGRGGSGTIFTYLFGPKFTLRRGKWSPFVEALFGGAWVGAGLDTECDGARRAQGEVCGFSSSLNSFSMALGGGVDYKLMDHISIRLFDADYLMTRFNVGIEGTNSTQSNVRVSTGVVFNF
jgi:opacity protein-like surface antigen